MSLKPQDKCGKEDETSSCGSTLALCPSARATPHGSAPFPSRPVLLPPNITVSPCTDQETRGRQSNSLGGARTPKATSLRPRGLAAAFSATVTKTGQGKKKRGEERQEMGRAGPTPSSCRFLPKSLRGPESPAAARGRPAGAIGLDALLLPVARKEASEGLPRQTTKGWGLPRQERSPTRVPRGKEGSEAPPFAGLRPAPPSLAPLSVDKAVAAPAGPRVCLLVPPRLPLPSSSAPPPPPVSLCLSPPLPLS